MEVPTIDLTNKSISVGGFAHGVADKGEFHLHILDSDKNLIGILRVSPESWVEFVTGARRLIGFHVEATASLFPSK